MCLIVIAWQAHADYRLVVAANRDEYFARPTAAAAFWTDAPQVLAGRDLAAGGTWMGITRSGRFAAVTNFRDAKTLRSESRSRGELVANFLTGNEAPREYLSNLASGAAGYNGFNLLVGDARQLCCYGNVDGRVHELIPGIYGLSNHLLDTAWPKVVAAKAALPLAIDALPDERALFALMRNDNVANDDQLPDTGVGPAWESLLSAAFVRGPAYGTRCSTILGIHRHERVIFDEQTWREGTPGPRVRFSFRIDLASTDDAS